ncbi:hypothetical protein FF38_03098 [Lucilia cuprina]|uniref:Uncharacterized protein n=1 Tax=Lucilia cuprina TaxID=7375 RepID=A0A0L0CJE0_LUCCU|nr:hypothetical protein FF38_03097 [Lucilia cuprina]KNC32525.1 hypothetical protein FF38_03098 [Lucilia cuprina]
MISSIKALTTSATRTSAKSASKPSIITRTVVSPSRSWRNISINLLMASWNSEISQSSSTNSSAIFTNNSRSSLLFCGEIVPNKFMACWSLLVADTFLLVVCIRIFLCGGCWIHSTVSVTDSGRLTATDVLAILVDFNFKLIN